MNGNTLARHVVMVFFEALRRVHGRDESSPALDVLPRLIIRGLDLVHRLGFGGMQEVNADDNTDDIGSSRKVLFHARTIVVVLLVIFAIVGISLGIVYGSISGVKRRNFSP